MIIYLKTAFSCNLKKQKDFLHTATFPALLQTSASDMLQLVASLTSSVFFKCLLQFPFDLNFWTSI